MSFGFWLDEPPRRTLLRLWWAALLALLVALSISCGGEQLSGDGGGYQTVSVGSAFTCALTLSGQIRCWGQNEANEAKGLIESPTRGVYKAISAGYYGSCALRENGWLKCWGRWMVLPRCGSSQRSTWDGVMFARSGKRMDVSNVGVATVEDCPGFRAALLWMCQSQGRTDVPFAPMEHWSVGER